MTLAKDDTDVRRGAAMFPRPDAKDMFEPDALLDSTALAQGLTDRPNQIDAKKHRTIVERVATAYAAMKKDQAGAPAAYQPTGEWANYLAERQSFYDALAKGDVSQVEAELAGFWRTPLGLIVKEYASYTDLTAKREHQVARFTRNVSRNYLIWREIFNRPASELAMPQVGNTWGYMIDNVMVTAKACRYHAMASQISELTRDVAHPVVAEIGAGFGGVAAFLLRDRPQLTFVDFDLPETLVLASYYIQTAWPDMPVYFYGEGDVPKTHDQLKRHRAAFLPNFALRELAADSVDLHLNMFSLSEVGPAPLNAYMGDIARSTRHYFLHNNMDRRGVINRGFERIPASKYPVDRNRLKLVYKHFDLFHGQSGDYREFLYERIG